MSGFVTGISISPLAPFDLYVRTDTGGVYRFDRTDLDWIYMFERFPTNARAEGVESLAVDPTNPNIVYAAFWKQNTNDGNVWSYIGEVWRSTDKGVNWTPTGLQASNVKIEPNGEFRAETGERLAVDPNKPENIWFGSRNDGVWVKRGSAAWEQVTGLPLPTTLFWGGLTRTDKPGFTWVLHDKSSGTSGVETPVVYVGAYGSGVWRRSTVGGTWTNISNTTTGNIQMEPLRAAIAANGDLYCVFGERNQFGSRGNLQRYRDGAWTNVTPPGAGALSGIAVHPDGNQILVSGNTKIWKSNNQGVNWTRCDADLRFPQNVSAPGYMTTTLANNLVVSIAFDPANANNAWFTNGFGVARSFNSNLAVPTWAWEMLGLEQFVGVMTRPVPTPLNNFYIYTAGMDKLGFKQSNLDAPATKNIAATGIPVPAGTPTWIVPEGTATFPAPLDSTTGCSAIDVAWANPQQAAFVGYHQVVDWIPMYGKTNDHGETWQAFGSVPTRLNPTSQLTERGHAGQIAVDRRGTDRMVWVPRNFNPHYTIDGGDTWQICKMAGTGANLFSSWANNINARVRSGVLESDKRINGRFYYLESTWEGLLYVSNDAGATWTRTSRGQFPTYRIKVTIAPNPFADNDVWFSFAKDTEQLDSKTNKLWRSTDGGQTVGVVSTVDSAEFVAIGVGEGSIPYYVYIFGRVGGATQDALYRSVDLGQTWQRVSDPALTRINGMVHLAADPRIANLLYISASGRAHQYALLPGTTLPTPAP
ncbi:MAG: hypothetical protein KME18_07810 [Phormidium tanganyikae FI6-MK23]|jgi:hypothetical protein|nr:hypothetical protein [Phormidium tanganyikae FI6-MK23]